ncbi:MAG: hypothetical protein OSA93_17255 [Akkermansiaceae bacterium]|nr:hypothetical protein [Akkermansiaceae bacterium]
MGGSQVTVLTDGAEYSILADDLVSLVWTSSLFEVLRDAVSYPSCISSGG